MNRAKPLGLAPAIALVMAGALACARVTPLPPPPPPPAPPSPTAPPWALSPAQEGGRQLFISKGCANCHGANLEFLVVVNLPEVSEAAVMRQVRKPTGMMPYFPETALSDEELGKIAGFVVAVLSQK